jgi:hypothetical protein
MKLVCVLLLTAFSGLLLIRYANFINAAKSEIDFLQNDLLEIKSQLKPNATVCFCSNVPEPDVLALYFRTQFCMAPVIVKQKAVAGDTTVIVEKYTTPLKDLSDYTVIKTKEAAIYRITLAVKNSAR